VDKKCIQNFSWKTYYLGDLGVDWKTTLTRIVKV